MDSDENNLLKNHYRNSVAQKLFPELKESQARFLEAYTRIGSLIGAAKESGVATMYHWRWKQKDEGYVAAFSRAREILSEFVEHALWDRAVNGVNVPEYYKGVKVDTYKEFSDRAAEIWLHGNVDRYKRNFNVQPVVPIQINVNFQMKGQTSEKDVTTPKEQIDNGQITIDVAPEKEGEKE
jgi:hypothetical protein